MLNKTSSKTKMNLKRKNSKDKRGTKMIENRKLAAKVPLSFEATAGGYVFGSSHSKQEIKLDKPINSTVGAYVLAKQRNSSMEDYSKPIGDGLSQPNVSLKAHKRSSQDGHKIHMTMNSSLSKWEDGGSVSPNTKSRSKYAKETLKNLTTQLTYGASRNSASKGIMTNPALKSSKKGKMKSPKYMTQGIGSYYLKGKNWSVLSK